MDNYHLKSPEWQYIYTHLQNVPRIRKEDEKALRVFVEGVFLPNRMSVAYVAILLWQMANCLSSICALA